MRRATNAELLAVGLVQVQKAHGQSVAEALHPTHVQNLSPNGDGPLGIGQLELELDEAAVDCIAQ
jgi:hypothetical protein